MSLPVQYFPSDNTIGGFYDRYIHKIPNIERIALAYECQEYEYKLPIDNTDQRPDFIITEKRIL